MRASLRTAGVALVGASVLAVTPILAIPPDVKIANPDVALSASPLDSYLSAFARARANAEALLELALTGPATGGMTLEELLDSLFGDPAGDLRSAALTYQANLQVLPEQQEVNVNLAADFTAFIRKHEPKSATISVGGEIGEVGGKNSDVHELHAYMDGFNAALKKKSGAMVGLSKISVQTGTAHGGFINADGTLRMDVKIDLKTLEELSNAARKDYGLGGAVQHGASTLPPDAFDAFPRHGACEIHLATDFQNMVYEHPKFPADLKSEMYGWYLDSGLATKRHWP